MANIQSLSWKILWQPSQALGKNAWVCDEKATEKEARAHFEAVTRQLSIGGGTIKLMRPDNSADSHTVIPATVRVRADVSKKDLYSALDKMGI